MSRTKRTRRMAKAQKTQNSTQMGGGLEENSSNEVPPVDFSLAPKMGQAEEHQLLSMTPSSSSRRVESHASVTTSRLPASNRKQAKKLERALKGLKLSEKADEIKPRREKKMSIRKSRREREVEAAEKESSKAAAAQANHVVQQTVIPNSQRLDTLIEDLPWPPDMSNYPYAHVGAKAPNIPQSAHDRKNESKKKPSKHERKLLRDLKRLKSDPEYPLDDERLYTVAKYHQRLGGSIDDLGRRAKVEVQVGDVREAEKELRIQEARAKRGGMSKKVARERERQSLMSPPETMIVHSLQPTRENENTLALPVETEVVVNGEKRSFCDMDID